MVEARSLAGEWTEGKLKKVRESGLKQKQMKFFDSLQPWPVMVMASPGRGPSYGPVQKPRTDRQEARGFRKEGRQAPPASKAVP